MEKYKNLGGKSQIESYHINDESIRVRYKDGTVYLFTNESAGVRNILKMKDLAIEGRELDDFINQRVWYRYARKYSAPYH